MKHIYLYLDDVRETPNFFNATVRSYKEFVEFIDLNLHEIKYVSFDHDLQDPNTAEQREKTGYNCLKYLIEVCIAEKVEVPKVKFHTHNPVGKQNMLNLYHSYLRGDFDDE